jgi:hypothetical protein
MHCRIIGLLRSSEWLIPGALICWFLNGQAMRTMLCPLVRVELDIACHKRYASLTPASAQCRNGFCSPIQRLQPKIGPSSETRLEFNNKDGEEVDLMYNTLHYTNHMSSILMRPQLLETLLPAFPSHLFPASCLPKNHSTVSLFHSAHPIP